ncbi:C2H2 finger domain protein [Xylaria longipes]|nr:C2H2 finger domain protein [Xylaria longipes]
MDSSEDDVSYSSDCSESDLASEYDVQSLNESSSEDSDDVLDLDFDDFQSVEDSEGSDLKSVATSEDNIARTSEIDHFQVNIDDAALEKLPCHENELGAAIPDEGADEEGLFDGNIYPIGFYQQGIANMDIEAYKRKTYAQGTETQVKAVENAWCLFCTKVFPRGTDYISHLRAIRFEVVYQFLHWHLGQRTGKGGRRKRTITKRNSLITFWCSFRLFFERVTTNKIDELVDRRLMHNALVELGKKFQLTHETRENRSMTLQDLKDQIECTLCTTEKTFELGELRILAVLFLLLLAPQGSRPTSILMLRFGDIKVLLVRDPTNPDGPPRLVIRLSLEYTKQYLGPKATKHFMIPEIIYDPSLLLSPHVFLLAILYRHRAFETEDLNASPAILNKLRIHPSGNEFPLYLRPELDNVFIFRRAAKSMTGYTISDAPIGYDMMSKWIKRIGVLLGFEHNTISYNLRYMAGNNLDQNVNISDALRNLIMDHAPQSDTFQKHYLNRNVVADLWAIHRNHQPQQALLEQATSHGHSKNSRRPVALTQAQMRAVLEGSAKYHQLTTRLASLGWGPKFRDQRREITLERDRLRKKLCNDEIKRVREAWARTQFADDIERQIRGESFTHESAGPNRDMRPMGPAQQRMFDALTTPLPDDIDAIGIRRTNAIEALIAYCTVEEPSINHMCRVKRKPEPEPQGSRTRTRHVQDVQDVQEPESRGKQVDKEQLWRSTFVSTMGKRKVRKCFVCVAKALTLEPNNPNFEALCRDFSTPSAAANHFLRIHANSLDEQDTSNCPICQVPLDDKMHLLNHAEGVHGLKTEKRYTME